MGTQTESGILYETVTTPSQKVLGDVYVCRHCKFKGGSVWLTGDPIKDKSTSRCIPLCTELTPVLQTSFDTKILKRVESCVAMVTEFSARHYLEKGFDQQASSSGNHLDGSREEKLYVISPKLREKFQHLFNLYHQLKQLHVEQLFWRHASYLAISIETLERYLSQQFQTCAVLKYSIMKYRMSGVATFILGSLVVEINNVLYQIVRNSDSSRLVVLKGLVEIAYLMSTYVRMYLCNGCQEPSKFLDLFKHRGEMSVIQLVSKCCAETEWKNLNCEVKSKIFFEVMKECKSRVAYLEQRLEYATRREREIIDEVIREFSAAGKTPVNSATMSNGDYTTTSVESDDGSSEMSARTCGIVSRRPSTYQSAEVSHSTIMAKSSLMKTFFELHSGNLSEDFVSS